MKDALGIPVDTARVLALLGQVRQAIGMRAWHAAFGLIEELEQVIKGLR